MNSSVLGAVPGLRSRVAGRVREGAWIESARFDIALLAFAPLLTLPIVAGMYFRIPFLAITCGLVLAFAHYWSTLSFYFWDENRAYLRERWIAFYLGPIVVVAAVLLLWRLQVPLVVQVVIFAWNTWHVSRQNCGILSIYRQRAGVTDPVQRGAANAAILGCSIFLALWNIQTHAEVVQMFHLESPVAVRALQALAGAVALACLARLGLALWRRPQAPGLPEAIFLLVALGFFHPYLFIGDSGMATYAMLLPHYVQYMALVWLLHRRKFGGAAQGAPRPLRLLSGNLWMLLATLLAVGYGFTALREVANARGLAEAFQVLFWIIVLLHFYLDSLIWSFRRPHVRATIGRHLMPAHPAREATP